MDKFTLKQFFSTCIDLPFIKYERAFEFFGQKCMITFISELIPGLILVLKGAEHLWYFLG